MDRRQFLLAGSASLLAGPAFAGGMMGMQGHDMTGMMGHDMGAMTGGPVPALPEGAPFADLAKLANKATASGSFEAEIIAGPAEAEFLPGIKTAILGYNGGTPGPMIEAIEGDKVRVRFANDIPGEDSTIHWHGLVIAPEQDGTPMKPVAPGASTTYEFTLPEGSAGSYWYHPHPHGFTASQVYRGLAGAFIVKAKADPIPADYGDTVLFVTDLRVAADGSLPENGPMDLMNGRIGDHILVNGQKNPELSLQAGTARRFRLYNACSARYLYLTFSDLALTAIGSDGGLLEQPVTEVRQFLVSPGERFEFIAAFDQPGSFRLTTLDYDQGWMGMGRPQSGGIDILTVTVGAEAVSPPPPLPEKLRPIAPAGVPTVTRRFELGETMSMGLGKMGMTFLINGKEFDMNRVDEVGKVGDVERWEVVNKTDMDHPFHLHGVQFQIEDVDGSPPPVRALKDTVNVARGQTVRLLVSFKDTGLHMYHCHILEHEDQGMMGMIDVRAA